MAVKFRNDVKNAWADFDTFYVITRPFLKIETSNFVHIIISHCILTYMQIFFVTKVDFRGELLETKNVFNFEFF